jgi:hypothetical protein
VTGPGPWDGQSDRLVAAFQKNAREQVYVRLHVFEGRPLIDIRVWYQDRETEEWRPTAKGVAVSTELYGALRAAIEEIDNHLDSTLTDPG